MTGSPVAGTSRSIIPPEFARETPVALYLHVPFCTAKCDYCGFFSVASQSSARMREVVSAEVAQARRLLCELGDPVVDAVYIGGGTPSVLPPRLLRDLAEGILGASGQDSVSEWTVEVNPETTSRELIEVLCDLPVTRVSVGVQSFRGEALAALGRRGSQQESERVLGALHRSGGAFSVGVDLIAGRPSAPRGELLGDVRRALSLGVDHLSVYALSVEPGTPLWQRVARGRARPAPDEQVVTEIESARNAMRAAGILRYEVSNYARPGRECRHNLAYWRLDPFIGIGPGAVSTLPGPGGRALRLENRPDIGGFLTAYGGGTDDSSEVSQATVAEHVPARSFFLEHLIAGLRTREGLSEQRLHSRFGRTTRELIPRTVANGLREATLWAEDGAVGMTERGLLQLDAFLAAAAGELDEHMSWW